VAKALDLSPPTNRQFLEGIWASFLAMD